MVHLHIGPGAMLTTVRVPPQFEGVFAAAERTVSRYFQARKDDPAHGTIEIFGERYVLVRGAALSVEFFDLVEQLYGPGREEEADRFARNLLFDLAHALGKSDAKNFHAKMNLTDPIARLSAGPVHFSHSGWAFVDISPESNPAPNDEYHLIYDHPYSFESDAWLRAGRSRDFPVCVMNAGYSSGWCEESFGLKLVASEVMCRARGDLTCRFIMAPPARIEERVHAFLANSPSSAAFLEKYAVPDFFARKRREVEVAQLYERLKELDALKTELFANVSHELRTPLTLIKGPVERLLATPGLGEEQRRDLEVIERNARILLKHVNDLLDVARLEVGKVGLRYAEVDLAELVRLVSANFEVFASDRALSLSVDAEGSVPAQLDADKIARVLTNLLSNACKFARTEIRVALRCDATTARLEVEDDGRGIPAALRESIFERFRQAERGTTREFGGTGLGLAIARELVELHHGKISAAAGASGGGLFVVELPRTAPEGATVSAGGGPLAADLAPQREARPMVTKPTEPRPDAPLVLIVDDNADMLQFLATTLGADYRVELASDGEQALAKTRALGPDLIVTDVMMPKLSGDELVRAVRADERIAATPIVVLTAKADDALRVRLLGEGVQDYLGKPFAEDELRARVRNCIAMKRVRDILASQLQTTTIDVERLAREVSEKNRELEDALAGMRIARDHAERASRSKTLFLSLVGHELATPLQTLLLNLEALRRHPEELTPRQGDKLAKIGRASRRLDEMIQALLEYVRIESGRLEVHCATTSLAELAETVIDDLGSLARQKALSLVLHVDGAVPDANTDARLVRLVLVNLVGNAIKYTDVGRIDITVAYEAGVFRIAVADTGHGIPLDQQAKIFEPFTQLESLEHKHTSGVGLGLTLVREIVKAIGGEIRLWSRPGEGSLFTLLLPRE